MTGTDIAKSGLTLAIIAAVCTALVAMTYQFTREPIERNQQALLEQSLSPALANVMFDGNVTESKLVLPAPHGLPGSDDAIVYRVFRQATPVAALFAVTARNGYAGPIRILVGVRYDGTVSGVRILEHRETPGLGDRIVSEKSDWVYQFEGQALGRPPANDWALKTDGGAFDQLTGASVTPRAVIQAIRETLIYFEANRDSIFAEPAREATP